MDFQIFRPFTKKRVNISFGNYPNFSLADAREKRANNRRSQG